MINIAHWVGGRLMIHREADTITFKDGVASISDREGIILTINASDLAAISSYTIIDPSEVESVEEIPDD